MQQLLTNEAAKSGCGAGQDAQCCIWLLMGPQGFECGRGGKFHTYLNNRTDMVSKRKPAEAYPLCQIQENSCKL